VEQSFKVLDLSNRNLKIKFEQIQLGILELSIYGLSGKKIKSISFDHSMMSPQTITIPLESITSGCYLIKLQTGNHIYTEMVTFGGI
jgi:hypothetical protein